LNIATFYEQLSPRSSASNFPQFLDGMTQNTQVAVFVGKAHYQSVPPFHPPAEVSDCIFPDRNREENHAYLAVRECFRIAGLDAANDGTPQWNPLAGLVRPGETVLLKPNLVKETHPRDPNGWQYVLTHGTIVRAVADYVWKALQGRGKIIVADAPQTDSSFTAITRLLGLDEIQRYYTEKGLAFELIDLRKEQWTNRDGVIVERRQLAGDPYGDVAFDLGNCSEFANHLGTGRYYGADYDRAEVNRHHSGGRHEYLLSKAAISCDVLFNLPKLKTHKKAGVTLALKNLVGINGDKNWLPHHTEGNPARGGDEHPQPGAKFRLERRLVGMSHRAAVAFPVAGSYVMRKLRRLGLRVFGDTEEVIRSGNWHGNDTVWRMCLDLNKLLAYGNTDGTIRDDHAANRKRHYVLVDGIIAGEGRGPIDPDPVKAGMLLFGTHAPSVDAACAFLMGFDPERIPIIANAFRCRHYSLASGGWRDIELSSNRSEWNGNLNGLTEAETLHFKPHFGWTGHIERPVIERPCPVPLA
jgi:uncharacterized protein (DUF362 family)